jgi:glycyl-tRNA synthetase (class II)
VAPTTVGVFPLMDRDGLPDYAREVAGRLREAGLSVLETRPREYVGSSGERDRAFLVVGECPE